MKIGFTMEFIWRHLLYINTGLNWRNNSAQAKVNFVI